MLHPLDDTIAALAAAAGPGARGIIRLSGPDCRAPIERLFEPSDRAAWSDAAAPRRHAGTIRLSRGVSWPASVYLWPGVRSYTGQPLAEVHCLSSPPLLEALLEELYGAGARPANPGEFTLRAFLSGRIDLIQAEAVLGVIDSHDHAQLDRALRQLAGNVSGPLARVRNNLLDLLADLEAGLDFVDEDITFVGRREATDRLDAAIDELERILARAASRMQTSGRRRVALAGLPNAGKSTLFNALAGRNAAIVSEISGTTRDYLRAETDWQGLPVEIIDTAGHDAPADAVPLAAQQLAREQLESADLIVWCTAADRNAAGAGDDELHVAALRDRGRPVLRVRTKCDLPARTWQDDALDVSARAGAGLVELKREAAALLADAAHGEDDLLGSTAARCRDSLTGAIERLRRARQAADECAGDEIVAFELRDALDDLARILGAVFTDDILDRVFSRFCIGK